MDEYEKNIDDDVVLEAPTLNEVLSLSFVSLLSRSSDEGPYKI